MPHEELSKVFNEHLSILDALIDDLKENATTWSGEEVTLEFFWIKICLAVQNVSKEATNLCMAFSGPPIPEVQEFSPIIKKLEGVAVSLVSAFYSLPTTFGMTLKKHVHTAVSDIVKAIHMLEHTILSHNFDCSKDQLQKTGNVWECCDIFPHLPYDNVKVVSNNISQWQGLVNDALEEIESAQQEAEDNGIEELDDIPGLAQTPQWSEQEKLIVNSAVGMVKASKAVLKKCTGVVRNLSSVAGDTRVAALDDLNERLKGVSAEVDDVVSCLYPPMEEGIIKQNVKDLSAFLEGILDYLRQSPLTNESDETWLNFLAQAVNHNRDKLYQLIPGE